MHKQHKFRCVTIRRSTVKPKCRLRLGGEGLNEGLNEETQTDRGTQGTRGRGKQQETLGNNVGTAIGVTR